jgi:uncharacterized membrane protein YidH (DUF202 family)
LPDIRQLGARQTINNAKNPMSQSATNDPRVCFAAEQTFLAWIRTGLALMGFGFVVARFGIFLQQIALDRGDMRSIHRVFPWCWGYRLL